MHVPCGNIWTGGNTSHCTACHENFVGITAFDAHRTGGWGNRKCLDPADAGMFDAGRKYLCWTLTDPEQKEDVDDSE
ncbi:hypothetical protein CJ179_38790 [Rhodococcus sp. ACS1]|nr:hypothetical protein CJ179_38790 [Rhodococcus sp. ACS1]